MSDMTDTSKEAVERVICAPIIRMVDRGGQPTLDGCAAIIDTARALLSERDALRAQMQAARDAQEGIINEAVGMADDESEKQFIERRLRRALKSTSA